MSLSGLTVIDHTEPTWVKRHDRIGNRPNGALTYSRELVQHQAPLWADVARRVTVSTCPVLSTVPRLPGGDVAVQYLHTYGERDPLRQARLVRKALAVKYRRIVFVAAYKPLVDQMNRHGYEALWVPMTIDVAHVKQVAGRPGRRGSRMPRKRVAYYGNLIGGKDAVFQQLRRELKAAGWRLDHVKGPQSVTLPALARYSYGIGVGRCLLEMSALGLRVMVAGNRFGGIMTTRAEWDVQRAVNWNGRVTTYDRSIAACLPEWRNVKAWPDDIDSAAGAAAVRAWITSNF